MADGEDTTTTTTKPDDAAARAAAATDDDDLGEKGTKALEAMKRRAREAEAWRKEHEPLVTQAQKDAEARKDETTREREARLAAERDAAESKGLALRYEVAADVGLPLKMAARLKGSTKEELEDDAKELLEALGGGEAPTKRNTNGNAGTEGAAPGGSMSDVLRAGLKAGRMTITT